jgi:hypothetical protein
MYQQAVSADTIFQIQLLEYFPQKRKEQMTKAARCS